MRNTELNQKQVARYLLVTFGLAYLIQFLAAPLYRSNRSAAQLVLAAMMFVPSLGVLLCGADLKGMGWKPRIRKNVRTILFAWFVPLLLAAAGAVLYFVLFPRHFDLGGGYVAALGGAGALDQLKEQGISYPMYVLISAVSIITYAPLLNMIAALGEELGWRGFLYPQLKDRFGRTKGWLLGGVIWGAWHWPLIALIGYEYGAAAGNSAGYAGAPVTGMLVFSVITAGLGVLHAWVYEKSECIWLPALLHGAFNAAAALPLMLCTANTGTFRLLGPAPNGLLSGLPFLIAAVLILRKKAH
jgi:membrane protease YdiL (CAAX protease family)